MSIENKVSFHPCPICSKQMFITGRDPDGKGSLTSCGHRFKFRRTKSEKVAEKTWIRTQWGLERIEK